MHARKRGFSFTEVLVSLVLIASASLLILKKQVELERILHDTELVGLSEVRG